MSLLDFLFVKKPKFATGSLESPVDARRIELASFQPPVTLPDYFETEIAPVINQGAKPKCTASASSRFVKYRFALKGIDFEPSDDWLYEESKRQDGIPNIDGTYPIVPTKIICKTGVPSVMAYKTGDPAIIAADCALHRLSGYAYVEPNYDAVCQAMYQNGGVTASLPVDNNFFLGIMSRVLQSVGRHDVILNGAHLKVQTVLGQNSWGIEWIGRVAGLFNPSIKPGHFEAYWGDIKDTILDIYAFADVPPELLEKAKEKSYRFTRNMKQGDTGYDVVQLQKFLNSDPRTQVSKTGAGSPGNETSTFGSATKAAVQVYQLLNGLPRTGNVYEMTRESMNKTSVSLIPLWAKATQDHEGYKNPTQYPPDGTPSYRYNNPGNFKEAGADGILSDYMRSLGASGCSADKKWVVFPSYDVGFAALQKFLTHAATGKLIAYKPTMSLLDFYNVYAPSSDSNNPLVYAQFIAKRLGVTIATPIKDLV